MGGDIAFERFGSRHYGAIQQHHDIARTRRIKAGAGAVTQGPVLRAAAGCGSGGQFSGGICSSDLRVAAQLGHQRIKHQPALCRGQFAAEVNITARTIAIKQRACDTDAERRANLLGQRRGAQRRIDPCGARQRLFVQPLGHVQPAVIGAEHHRIIDPRLVEHGKERPQRAIKLCHLDAHLGAFGASRMADIIGR